jgi:RND family efflux transporter MFP subunit
MFRKNVFFVLLILPVFLAASCAENKEQTAVSMDQLHTENGQPVSVRRLEAEDFSVYLKYPTIIYAASESTAYAGLSDVVRRISVKVGEQVSQDAVIVSFSADNQTLRQAALAHENAANAFNRSRALFKNNDISRQDYDSVRMQYELARANLKAANDMVYVKAPISGTVTQINVHATENIRPGSPLFTVSGQSGFEARFYVGAAEIDRIQSGARVRINEGVAQNSMQSIEGRVTQVSLTMDSQKQAFPVSAFFETANNKLVSGMGVDISVETYRNEKAIVLSRKELVETENGFTAFVAEGDTARQVAVQSGQEQGFRVEIAGGLSEGDMLISEGIRHIASEQKINVVTNDNNEAILSFANKQ